MSHLKPKEDPHQISLDLNGLEEFLSADFEVQEVVAQPAAVSVPVRPAPAPKAAKSLPAIEPNEHDTILNLLYELSQASDMMRQTQSRVDQTQDRINSMQTMLDLQAQQLELLNYYQTQAARLPGLEHKMTLLKQEIIRIRRPWYQKFYDLLTK